MSISDDDYYLETEHKKKKKYIKICSNRKIQEEDMSTQIKGSSNSLKLKSNQSVVPSPSSSSKSKTVLPLTKKKIENPSTTIKSEKKIENPSTIKPKIENPSTRKLIVSKTSSISTVVKSELRGKTTTTTSSSKTVAKATAVRVKSVKRVYTLAGQKCDPPEEREPLRIFYESLSKQIPSSEMAEFWMMEHGLLSPERAKKAYARKQKRQQQIRMGTPIKFIKAPERPESSQKKQQQPQLPLRTQDIKPKKRIITDDHNDFIVKRKRMK